MFALYTVSFHTVQAQNRRYKATGRAVLVPVTDLLLSKYPIIVIKSLELESITTRIQEKHRGLFSDLISEAHTRGDHEFLVDGAKAFSQRMPLLPGEDGPEVGDRHIVSIHRVGDGGRDGSSKVNAELVTEEIEVDPDGYRQGSLNGETFGQLGQRASGQD